MTIENWKLAIHPNGECYLLTGPEIVMIGPNTYESVFANNMIQVEKVDKEPGLYPIKINVEIQNKLP